MSCGIGHRYISDLALWWLWHWQVATVLTGPLAWEPPYVMGIALRRQKKKKKKKKKKEKEEEKKKEKKNEALGVPVMAQLLANPPRNHHVAGSIPSLTQWSKDPELP